MPVSTLEKVIVPLGSEKVEPASFGVGHGRGADRVLSGGDDRRADDLGGRGAGGDGDGRADRIAAGGMDIVVGGVGGGDGAGVRPVDRARGVGDGAVAAAVAVAGEGARGAAEGAVAVRAEGDAARRIGVAAERRPCRSR